MSEEITPQQIRQFLDLELDDYHGHRTGRAFLLALLRGVWNEGEGFNGKRPFGNSSWEYDLFAPMVKAGIISGTLDEDGDIEDVDERAGNALVLAAIDALDAPHAAAAEGAPGIVPLDAAVLHREVHRLSGQVEAVRALAKDALEDALPASARAMFARAVLSQLDEPAAAEGAAAELATARDALLEIARAAQGSIDTSLPLDRDWVVSEALRGRGELPADDEDAPGDPFGESRRDATDAQTLHDSPGSDL